ncbi:hydrogenase formation protein HypD [Bacillus marinisedimentorum]|uniref:hydrogenase formation protein HypD n=1 Tax=Bacillus marinisedimentorum TaxID=1821260 RepID=UPI0007E02928|nr:hydrogenase formation protein HypD [Bacillus marinisedimentorum]
MASKDSLSDPVLMRRSAEAVIELAGKVKAELGRIPVFMEVCGSHTMAFAKSGIKARLHEDVRLIAGPGCPVCVTDQKSIDGMIQLAEGPDRILCTFGDMMRVPGSKSTLMKAKTNGGDIRVVYSPLESVKLAEDNPGKEVIFLGIGFETTIPILALAVDAANTKLLNNFSVWMATKRVEPVMRALLDSGEMKLDGFLLPGHVSVVSGERSYRFLADEYRMPGVISGFEPVQLLSGIYKLLEQVLEKKAGILNDYPAVVTEGGNIIARKYMDKYFEPHAEAWRGMGEIPDSGYVLKDRYARFDARKKFAVSVKKPGKSPCRCGEIIRGLITPEECALFNKGCTPANPAGPCMVSTEGTCAAHYQYMREE